MDKTKLATSNKFLHCIITFQPITRLALFYEVILIKPKDDFGNAMSSIEIAFKHTLELHVVPIIPPSVCCSLHPFYMIDNSMNVTFKFLEDIIQSPCENSTCTNNSVTQEYRG